MIKISYEELLLFVFLAPIAFVFLFNVLVFCMRLAKNTLSSVKDGMLWRKKMRDIQRRKKEEGFMHQWVNLKVPSIGSIMVCKETGYCPKFDGFFDVKWVASEMEIEKRENEIVKEREDNFKKKMEEISLEFNINADQLQAISDKILSINKDFTIKKLEDLKNEIKKKSF